MTYVVLARKYRPQTFSDLVGQDHVARTLSNAIEANRVAHAFLFTGVRGVGKTTSARILAKALNCMQSDGPTSTPCLKCPACVSITDGSDVDVQEIDGASYNGVNEVRRLQDGLPYRPQRDRYKIIIVDEVHMLSSAAWNAFLKTLEEPPEHVKFIFATTEVHKVPITILSRVQRFDFKLISAKRIAARLSEVLSAENVKTDDPALALIAREAEGSMRDAMSLLDQVIAWGGEELEGQSVAEVLGVASHQVLYSIAQALLSGNAADCIQILDTLAERGGNIEHVARDILALLRDLVVAKVCDTPDKFLDLTGEETADVLKLAQASELNDLLRLQRGFANAFDEVVRSGQPKAALEMLLVRLARRPPLIPLDGLVERLAALEKRTGASRAGRPNPPPNRPTRTPDPNTPTQGRMGRPAARERSSSPSASAPMAEPADEPPPAAPEPQAARAPVPTRPKDEAAQASPAAPTPPAATDPEASARGVRIRAVFRQVIAEVSESVRPGLRAMLEHAVPLELTDQELVVGFPATDLFPEFLDKQNVQDEIRAAAARANVGVELRIRTDLRGAPKEETVAGENARLLAEQRRQIIEDAKRHPAVKAARDVLGARIREVHLRERRG